MTSNAVPDRLQGVRCPEALPEDHDLGVGHDPYKATNEMADDLLAVIKRYDPAVSRSEITGTLMRLILSFEGAWWRSDEKGDG